ncbi:Flagellar basal-body rod protein FlgF [Paramixta manurensis]|uniref:Flagellar basal-body rod protein FlgF n=1 Tax=Paramixta manurensis TaxID=2740817 RepID=A0A6M8U7Z0_9GAMM|nr:Flagellar basal-body rod protein FlgF [Erwiniaceae bacterium PD-1]
MDRLIYTAVSGATRSLTQQTIHANNLANAATDGFRADLERAGSQQVAGYGYDSRYMAGSENGGVDMTAGTLTETGRSLDIGIKGDGLIALRDGRREVYTRNGHLDVDPEGNLTVNGLPVLGEAGPITLPPFSSVSVGEDGTLTVIPDNGDFMALQDVDRIKLVNVPANRLSKNNDGFLVSNRRAEPRSEAVSVVGKHLETSNVSAMNEMVSTLSLSRQFEAQIKMMKVADTLAQAGNRLIRGS